MTAVPSPRADKAAPSGSPFERKAGGTGETDEVQRRFSPTCRSSSARCPSKQRPLEVLASGWECRQGSPTGQSEPTVDDWMISCLAALAGGRDLLGRRSSPATAEPVPKQAERVDRETLYHDGILRPIVCRCRPGSWEEESPRAVTPCRTCTKRRETERVPGSHHKDEAPNVG